MRQRPGPDEYAPFYETYVSALGDGDILDVLAEQEGALSRLLSQVSAEQEGYAYAPGKWTMREVVGHMIDVERLFVYRALAFARGDEGPLPGMDENGWMAVSSYDDRSLSGLIEEFEALRTSTAAFFAGLPDEAWGRSGVASGTRVTVRGLAWITAGHAAHHMKVLAERYLT